MNFEKAIALIESGEIEEGLQQLEEVGQKGSHDEKFELIMYYMQLGLVDKALKLAEELYELYPDEGQLLLVLGELYMELDREEEAIEVLNDIHKDDELYVQSLLVLADVYQMQGLEEVAEQKLLEAKRILPEESIIDFGLGEFYFSQENYRKSAAYYESVLAQHKELSNVNISLRLAESLSGFGEWEQAIPFYETGLEESKEIYSMFQFANTLMQAEFPTRAIKILNELKELDPEISGLYLLQAQAYEAEGMLEESHQALREGLKFDEYNVDLLMALAKISFKLHDMQGAEKALEEALALETNFMEAILLLSELYLKQEKYEETVQLLTDAMNNGEHAPHFHWDLATATKELELFDDALKYYEEAYTFFKTQSDFLEEYGYFLLEEGQREKAKAVFENILSLDATLTHIEELLQNLREE